MPACKYCGTSGIFLGLTKNGLCNKCDQTVIMDIQNKVKNYNESIELIEFSNKPFVVFTRIQLAKGILSSLFQYEEKAIPTTYPKPAELFKVLDAESDKFLFFSFSRASKSLATKIFCEKSNSSKINHIQKFIDKIDEYLPKVNCKQSFSDLRQDWVNQLQMLQNEDEKNRQYVLNIIEHSSLSNIIMMKQLHPAVLFHLQESSIKNGGAEGRKKSKVPIVEL